MPKYMYHDIVSFVPLYILAHTLVARNYSIPTPKIEVSWGMADSVPRSDPTWFLLGS